MIHQRMDDVRFIARSIHERLPYHVPFEDLVHDGVVGLIDAAHKFDHAKQTSFRTYAKFRIRGAIIDSMRQMDWGPRSVRRQCRELEHARQKLTHALGRYPSEGELAGELGMPLERLYALLTKVDSLRLASLTCEERDGEHKPSAMSLPTKGDTPLSSLLKSESKSLLVEAMEKLSPNKKKVLSLYYFEEYSLKQIGELLGFSEGRASQIRSQAVAELREALADFEGCEPSARPATQFAAEVQS